MTVTIHTPIVQRRQLGGEIVEVTCQLNGTEFPFKAGQHIQVTLPSLSFQDKKGNMRTFNILSSPNNSQYLSFAFVNSDSAFKKTITQIPENTEIQIKGAFGMFTLPQTTKNLVFITEGIGIVPCMSILLYATEEKLPNKIKLIHFGNNLPYNEDLLSLQKINHNLSVIIKNGTIDSKFIKNNIDSISNSLFYISGTTTAIRNTKQILLQMGIDQIDIKTEEFTGY